MLASILIRHVSLLTENNSARFIHKDVANLKPAYLRSLFSRRKILVGCAPCQAFSIYTHKTSVEEKKQGKGEVAAITFHSVTRVQSVNPDNGSRWKENSFAASAFRREPSVHRFRVGAQKR